jgi:hypothetical protein
MLGPQVPSCLSFNTLLHTACIQEYRCGDTKAWYDLAKGNPIPKLKSGKPPAYLYSQEFHCDATVANFVFEEERLRISRLSHPITASGRRQFQLLCHPRRILIE